MGESYTKTMEKYTNCRLSAGIQPPVEWIRACLPRLQYWQSYFIYGYCTSYKGRLQGSLHISDTMIKYEKQQKKYDRGISRDVGLFECGEVVVC